MDKRPETRVATKSWYGFGAWMRTAVPSFRTPMPARSEAKAQISGITHPLKAGDIIGVQYGEKKARCKVIWVIDGWRSPQD